MTNTCKNTYDTEVLETVMTYSEWLKEYKRRTCIFFKAKTLRTGISNDRNYCSDRL